MAAAHIASGAIRAWLVWASAGRGQIELLIYWIRPDRPRSSGLAAARHPTTRSNTE